LRKEKYDERARAGRLKIHTSPYTDMVNELRLSKQLWRGRGLFRVSGGNSFLVNHNIELISEKWLGANTGLAGTKDRETIVIKQKDAPDITVELAGYLDILGSAVRLKILRLLELEPIDVEFISHLLWKRYGKTSSRENTKKHVDKLLSIGLVMKKPGERDNRAVMNYVMVPGSVETVMRTLRKVMKWDLKFELSSKLAGVRERVSEEFSKSFAVVRVLGGVDDRREFILKETDVRVGRVDPENTNKYDLENDIVLSDDYRLITRASKPHARLFLENGQWYVQHAKGQNPTYLWNERLDENRKRKLKNGDIIHLAETKGTKSAHLVFILPEAKNKNKHYTDVRQQAI
jgi:hypothetical protein